MDMLIKLYDLPHDFSGVEGMRNHGQNTQLRKPIAPEFEVVVAWVAGRFSPGWASEARVALANRPLSIYVAVQSDAALAGFCAYDTSARGFVGPIGVAESQRRSGLGAALLRACLADMRALGYGYAVAGAVGAPEFFRRVAGAVEIEGSSPGIYRGMLKA